MALVRCPQCGRVADNDGCLACGYEWSQKVPVAPSATPAPASDDVLDELLALDGVDLQPAAQEGAVPGGATGSGLDDTDVSLDDLDEWLGVGTDVVVGTDLLGGSVSPVPPPAAVSPPQSTVAATQTPQASWQPPFIDLGQAVEVEAAREAMPATRPAPQAKVPHDAVTTVERFEPPTRRVPSLHELEQAPFEVAAAGLGSGADFLEEKTRVGRSVTMGEGQTLSARVIGLASSLDAAGRTEDAALLHEAALALMRHEL